MIWLLYKHLDTTLIILEKLMRLNDMICRHRLTLKHLARFALLQVCQCSKRYHSKLTQRYKYQCRRTTTLTRHVERGALVVLIYDKHLG